MQARTNGSETWDLTSVFVKQIISNSYSESLVIRGVVWQLLPPDFQQVADLLGKDIHGDRTLQVAMILGGLEPPRTAAESAIIIDTKENEDGIKSQVNLKLTKVTVINQKFGFCECHRIRFVTHRWTSVSVLQMVSTTRFREEYLAEIEKLLTKHRKWTIKQKYSCLIPFGVV